MGWRKKKDGQQAGRTGGGFLQKMKKSGRAKTSNKSEALSMPQDQIYSASSYRDRRMSSGNTKSSKRYCEDEIQYYGEDFQYAGDHDEEYKTPVRRRGGYDWRLEYETPAVRRRGRLGYKKRSGKSCKKSDDFYRHNIPEPPEEYSIAEAQNSDASVESEDPCTGCIWNSIALGQIQEEVTGTFIDVAESFFQVSTACVIREHELEGMVNTVRTAEIKPNTTNNGHMGILGSGPDIRDDDNTNFPTLDESRFTDAEDEESILMLPGIYYGSRCMGDANQFSNIDSRNGLVDNDVSTQ